MTAPGSGRPTVLGIDHVQLAMPAGPDAEASADRFYGEVLGLAPVARPVALAGRGGRWYRAAAQQVHLGVDERFRPATKAHPGLLVAGFDGLLELLAAAGVGVEVDTALPGVRRAFVADPFGNRLELIAAERAGHDEQAGRTERAGRTGR